MLQLDLQNAIVAVLLNAAAVVIAGAAMWRFVRSPPGRRRVLLFAIFWAAACLLAALGARVLRNGV